MGDNDISMDMEMPSEEERGRIMRAMELANRGIREDDPGLIVEAMRLDPTEVAHYMLTYVKGSDLARQQLTELRKLLAEERQMASIDGRTGLFRPEKYARDVISHIAVMERDKRYNDARPWLSMLLIDLDRFKMFNELGGYSAGNRALAAVAHEIKAEASRFGEAYRYAGDEMAILLPNMEPEEAKSMGDKIRQRVEGRGMEFPGSDGSDGRVLTVSVGVGYLGGDNYPEEMNSIYTDRRLTEEFFRDMADNPEPDRFSEYKGVMEEFHSKWDPSMDRDVSLAVIREYRRRLMRTKGFRDFHLNLHGKGLFYRANAAVSKAKNKRNAVEMYDKGVTYNI